MINTTGLNVSTSVYLGNPENWIWFPAAPDQCFMIDCFHFALLFKEAMPYYFVMFSLLLTTFRYVVPLHCPVTLSRYVVPLHDSVMLSCYLVPLPCPVKSPQTKNSRYDVSLNCNWNTWWQPETTESVTISKVVLLLSPLRRNVQSTR